MTSPNMSLNLPIVQETLGPTYAQMNNEAFEEIDSHDHTDGKGVQVPTAGININLDLPMNGFAVTEANALSLQDVDGTPEILSVYSDEGDLYYRNASGTAVQLTSGDTIVGTVGSISGLGDGGSSASFSDLSEDFSWFYNGSKLAAFNIGDIRLFPFDGTTEYSNKITLKSPTTLASDYALTLATTLPANTNFVQVSSSGQLSYTNTITQPVLAANGSNSNPSYSFSGDVDSGLRYNSGLSLVFGGTERFRVDGNQIKSARTAGANETTPDYSFLNDTNTGMYSQAADRISFSTGGTLRLEIRSTALVVDTPLLAATGSAAAPTLSFSNDPDTGLWNQTTNAIGFATAGVQRLTLTSTDLISTLPYTGTTGAFSGAVTADTLNLNGGGAFKVKYFTGTIVGSGSATLNAGSTILGVSAWCTNASVGSIFAPIMNGVTDVYYNLSLGTASTIELTNSAVGNRTYRVVAITT